MMELIKLNVPRNFVITIVSGISKWFERPDMGVIAWCQITVID